MTRTLMRTIGDFHVNDALAEVRRLGDLPGYFAPQQFDNEWNVDENREWLAQEIPAQLPFLVLIAWPARD